MISIPAPLAEKQAHIKLIATLEEEQAGHSGRKLHRLVLGGAAAALAIGVAGVTYQVLKEVPTDAPSSTANIVMPTGEFVAGRATTVPQMAVVPSAVPSDSQTSIIFGADTRTGLVKESDPTPLPVTPIEAFFDNGVTATSAPTIRPVVQVNQDPTPSALVFTSTSTPLSTPVPEVTANLTAVPTATEFVSAYSAPKLEYDAERQATIDKIRGQFGIEIISPTEAETVTGEKIANNLLTAAELNDIKSAIAELPAAIVHNGDNTPTSMLFFKEESLEPTVIAYYDDYNDKMIKFLLPIEYNPADPDSYFPGAIKDNLKFELAAQLMMLYMRSHAVFFEEWRDTLWTDSSDPAEGWLPNNNDAFNIYGVVSPETETGSFAGFIAFGPNTLHDWLLTYVRDTQQPAAVPIKQWEKFRQALEQRGLSQP